MKRCADGLTDSQTLEHNFLNGGYNIIPRLFEVAGYKKLSDCLICFSKKWPEMLVFKPYLILKKKISRQQKYAADHQSSNLLLIFSPELPFSMLGLLILEERLYSFVWWDSHFLAKEIG